MTSLEELEDHSPIREFIVRTINPKKEFATPGGGGTSGGGGGTPGGGGGTPDGGGGTPDGGTNNSGDAKSKADAEAKAKDPATRNKLIAAGVAAAAVAGITAAALASFIASAGAEINFNTIVPEKNSANWVPDFFQGTPTKVDVTWSVKSVKPGGIASAVKVLQTDTIEWHDSTIDTLDGQSAVQPTKVKDEKKEFVVESGKSDSSTINLTNKGYGVISTSFDAHVTQAVKDAGQATGDILGSFLEGLSGVGIGGIIIIIVVVMILITVVPLLIPKSNNK